MPHFDYSASTVELLSLELQPAGDQYRTIMTARMTDNWRGNTDIVGGKLAEYLPQISMSEQKLSKRLREVVRWAFCFFLFSFLSLPTTKDVEPIRKI